ncbi:MAG: M20/M25/M40 family metallo-hydrolase [Microthrixaceae bacterium]
MRFLLAPLVLFSLGVAAPAEAPAAQDQALARIATEAMKDEKAYANLQWLCDRIGHRLAGSKGLEAAVAWGQTLMKAEGFQNVRAEKVMVPHWERLAERADVVAPLRRPLAILGLGGSASTPEGGIEAPVLCLAGLADLEKTPAEAVKGRIVLFTGPWRSYGPYSDVRVRGASAAARKGAAAMLLKAFAPVSLDTPHTGVLHYDAEAAEIPAAGLSVEGAGWIERLAASGTEVRVHLDLRSRRHPDAESANVIGEIPGTEKPEEIIVIGGHLDSWDVGQGAQDDGVGCVLSLHAAELLQRIGLRPRRTLRVVLFTNEENGSRGGKAYLEAHRSELHRHVAAIESDIGNGLILGFSIDVGGLKAAGEARQASALRNLQALAPRLAPLGAARFEKGGSGVDVGPMVAAGVPGLGARHDLTKYWDIHHTAADTFDKIDKQDLRKNLAILASLLYLIGDAPERP